MPCACNRPCLRHRCRWPRPRSISDWKPRKRRFAHWHFIMIAIVAYLRRSTTSSAEVPNIPYSYAEKSAFAAWPQESNRRERRSSVARRELSSDSMCPEIPRKSIPARPSRGSILSRHSLDDRLSELRLLQRTALARAIPSDERPLICAEIEAELKFRDRRAIRRIA